MKNPHTTALGPLVPLKCILDMHADALKASWETAEIEEELQQEYWKYIQKEMRVPVESPLPDHTIHALSTLLTLASSRYRSLRA